VNTLYRVEGLESCKTGAVAIYTLLPEDEFGKPKDIDTNYVTVFIRGPTSVAGTVKRALQGQYTLEFRPLDPGTYWLDVLYDNVSIFKEGDITLQVSMHSPRVRQSLKFEFDGPGVHSARINERTEFTILTKDDHGQPVDIDVHGLEVRARGPGDTNEVGQVHREGSVGKFKATYQVKTPGVHTLTVFYDNAKVMEELVRFSDVTRGERSQVVQAPGTGRARETVKVKLQSKDMHGNNVLCGGDQWQAISMGQQQANIVITDHLDGTYSADLTFPRAGVYTVDFKLLGASAVGSPIKLTIS